MTQAKIEPGKTDVSPAGKDELERAKEDEGNAEHDLLPELGLKRPVKKEKEAPSEERKK